MSSLPLSPTLAAIPISDHYARLPNFKAISHFRDSELVSFIGVVSSFSAIKPTKGTDLSRSMVVCDPTASLPSTGVMVQFYKPSEAEMPWPVSGSVIIFYNFKLHNYRGNMQAWTNHQSKWIIYDANGSKLLSKSWARMPDPEPNVITYLKRFAVWWKARNGQSATVETPAPANVNVASAHTQGRTTMLLKDVKEGIFFDVYGYVVKTYPSRDNAFTIYITDYTVNTEFHEYVYGESNWKGPFGQRTMQVTLWDNHAAYASRNVHDDQFIFLRNVHGKRNNAGNLEGAVRGDRYHPDRLHVYIMSGETPYVKGIKQRRTQYENTWKMDKEKKDEEFAMQQQADRILQMEPPRSINPNLLTSYEQIPITAVGDILEPPYIPQVERQEGPGARMQPHKYRTIGRIVDFLPTDLRDFSKPYCMSCSATYTPKDPALNPGLCTVCNKPRDTGEPEIYEFSFALLVEGQDCVCLPLIFCGDDVEYLLGDEIKPCNLYAPENTLMLNKLRERLFLLWGNLEEQFSAPPSTVPKKVKGDVEDSFMWNHMCVMEYWVNGAAGEAGWKGRRFRGFGMALV